MVVRNPKHVLGAPARNHAQRPNLNVLEILRYVGCVAKV